ncbi:MAG: helix-turn-helix domain-containing protein [Bacteroidales bacterium]
MVSKYSIAVIPFRNLSPDKDSEYFSDGITEEIISALSKIEGLYVTSRTSSFKFKNQALDSPAIGEKLNVSFLLEGSVRYSDGNVRISAQLINTQNGIRVWAETWDKQLNDIFIFQDEIAETIACKINKHIIPVPQSTEAAVQNTFALDMYLRGQYLLNKLDSSKSEQMMSFLEQSVSAAPNYYKPIVALCNSFTWLASIGLMDPKDARAKIDNYIDKLFELNLPIPDMYLLLAERNFWIEWKPLLALQNINKALELKPSSSIGLIDKGMAQAAIGKVEEAFDSYFQAERLNPYGENINYCIGLLYHLIGENAKALRYLDQNIDLAPYWHASYFTKTESLCELGRFGEVWALIDDLENNPAFATIIPLLKGICNAYSGKMDETFQLIKSIETEISSSTVVSPFIYYIAIMFLKLGQADRALDYLEKGMTLGATPFLFIHIDCNWDDLRGNSRFEIVIKKISVPVSKNLFENDSKKYKKSALSKEMVETIKVALRSLMQKELPFLNPTLSLAQLSEQINITPNQLSQYLNEYEKKNFFEYMNTFRLNHFLEIAKNAKFTNLSLLGLAYESGFNSKTTFNTFFKREMGTSPSEYLKKK